MGELGVRVADGKIVFDTKLINEKEFLKEEKVFDYYTLDGQKHLLPLYPGQLGFTLCQKPIVYTLSESEQITVMYNDGQKTETPGNTIDEQLSSLVFNRSDKIKRIEVMVKI